MQLRIIMKFSLIIPVAPYRNAEIIDSIRKLNFPKKDFEVIVEKGPNASENRNKGFERSKGKVIVLLDDDGIIEEDLLTKAEKFFKEHEKIDIVGGPQLTPLDEKGFAKISGYALASKFGGWDTSNRYGKKKLNLNADDSSLTSAIMFCKRKVMKKIKFDVHLWPGEDPKFIAEAKREGFKVAYSPDLLIYHRRRPTIRGLIKQIFNYGRVGPLKEKFRDTIKKPFFLIPSLFVIYLLFFVLFLTLGIKKMFLFFPLSLYFLLDLFFSFYESLKNRDIKGIFLLPLIFPTVHISYGTGRIYGYLRKIFD